MIFSSLLFFVSISNLFSNRGFEPDFIDSFPKRLEVPNKYDSLYLFANGFLFSLILKNGFSLFILVWGIIIVFVKFSSFLLSKISSNNPLLSFAVFRFSFSIDLILVLFWENIFDPSSPALFSNRLFCKLFSSSIILFLSWKFSLFSLFKFCSFLFSSSIDLLLFLLSFFSTSFIFIEILLILISVLFSGIEFWVSFIFWLFSFAKEKRVFWLINELFFISFSMLLFSWALLSPNVIFEETFIELSWLSGLGVSKFKFLATWWIFKTKLLSIFSPCWLGEFKIFLSLNKDFLAFSPSYLMGDFSIESNSFALAIFSSSPLGGLS